MKIILKKILPRPLVDKLLTIRNRYFGGYALKSYSQEGEDMILRRVFEEQTSGFYVDVGAHHPKRFSNTYFFYKKGWSGINIDATPGSMALFRRYRPRDINIERPISSSKQMLTFYAFNEPALNGFSKELSEARDGLKSFKIKYTQKLETSTLEEVLDGYLPANRKIDFLSIDVEGLDFDVLKSINFDCYKPRVVLVELLDVSVAELEQNAICRYMKLHGYSIYAKAVNTVIFKSNSF